jgi:hypothetical protein
MMSESTALIQVDPGAIMPVMSLEVAGARRQAIVDFTKSIMVNGRDYGVIPGTGKDAKPTLLKPGAEKLTTFFGLSPRYELIDREMDWTGERHGGEAFFYLQYKCQLWRNGVLVGEGVGSCNSWERKYRYRRGERTCPECGASAIIKGKAQYGGGWLCYRNKGGCGAKWADGDPLIEKQEVGQVANDNPADLVNTIDKMAQKRALIAATLIAVNASEFFTQDIEDMPDYSGVVEGDWQPAEPPAARPQPASNPPDDSPANGKPTNGNGRKPTNDGPFPDDELVILETAGANFLNSVAALIDRYDNAHAAKNALKKLGYGKIPGSAPERLEMYRALKAHAAEQDAMEAQPPAPETVVA